MSDMEQKERRGRRRRNETVNEEAENDEVDDTETDDEARGLTAKKGYATAGRRNAQAEVEENPGIVARFLGYIHGVRSEIEKVAWPTRPETYRLMVVVLAVTLATAAFLGVVSFLFNELFLNGLSNPIIFVVFGVVVAAVTYWYIRNHSGGGTDTDGSSFTSRL